MGFDAQVIAIGPFSVEIASSLEYGEGFYVDVAKGTTVMSNVFIAETGAASHALASAFGVGAMELGGGVTLVQFDGGRKASTTNVSAGDARRVA